jgi:hypothetical protein
MNGRKRASITSWRGRLATIEVVESSRPTPNTPWVWWNLDPGLGQSPSTSRISLDPTTQWP